MNLSEMRSRAWWAIEDNEANPKEMSAEVLTGIINDALMDLAPYVNIEKSTTLTFVAGVATLPTDFEKAIAVYDGDVRLAQIANVTDKVADDASCSQFYIPNSTQIHIYGQTPAGTVTIYYKAYPSVLNDDADIPSDIPIQFHHEIPETYVVAQYKKRLNQLGDFATLMNQWQAIKLKIRGATNFQKYNQNF